MIKNIFSKILSNKPISINSDPIVYFVHKTLSSYDKTKLLTIPIKSATFSVIDTETTGLDLKEDKILSIAAVKIKNLKIYDIYNTFLEIDSKIPEESKKFHGIDDENLKDKPKIKEIFPDFINFIKNSVIVGHHIKFDTEMINRELKRFYNIKLPNYQIDTGMLFNFLTDGEGNTSLDALMERFHVKCEDRHSALGDAIATAEVFIKILSKFGSRFKTFEDLQGNKLLLSD